MIGSRDAICWRGMQCGMQIVTGHCTRYDRLAWLLSGVAKDKTFQREQMWTWQAKRPRCGGVLESLGRIVSQKRFGAWALTVPRVRHSQNPLFPGLGLRLQTCVVLGLPCEGSLDPKGVESRESETLGIAHPNRIERLWKQYSREIGLMHSGTLTHFPSKNFALLLTYLLTYFICTTEKRDRESKMLCLLRSGYISHSYCVSSSYLWGPRIIQPCFIAPAIHNA